MTITFGADEEIPLDPMAGDQGDNGDNGNNNGGTSATNGGSAHAEGDGMCWCCHKHPITYQPQTCDCAIYCQNCAMKMATGGICKKCKKLYPGMRRMR